MRILLINNEFLPIGGGGSTVTYYIARHLVDLGHEVHVVTSGFQDLPRFQVTNGVHIHRVPAARRYRYSCAPWELLTFVASALFFCLRLIPRFKPEIVQAYFSVPAGGVAYVLNRVYGTRYCVYLGGSDVPGANLARYGRLYPFLTPFVRAIWRRAAAVTAASQRLVRLANQADPKVPVEFIPNGVDLSRFRPNPSPNPAGQVKILGVGRLIARKGFQYIVEALPSVRDRVKEEILFEIVGTGEHERQLRELAASLGVERLVHFVGSVPYEELHHAYQGADIFVITSLAEGMPCVLLEAMGCGLPVIASRISGNEDVILHGRNGFLVEIGDKEALVEALATLVTDRETRRAMGRESLRLARRYDWGEITRAYDRIYQRVLSETA